MTRKKCSEDLQISRTDRTDGAKRLQGRDNIYVVVLIFVISQSITSDSL